MIPDSCIHAYMTPHPLDHDNHWEDDFLSWIPGYLNEKDEEQGTHAYLRDENIALYERIEGDIEEWMKKAMANLWPLMQDIQFKSVQVAIDIFNNMLSGQTAAGYNYDVSKPAKGIYHFALSSHLFQKRMKYRLDGKELEFYDEITFEHEFIHMLDHQESVRGSLFRTSSNVSENLRSCMLEYRSEGIAELYYLLHGHYDSIASIEKAKETAKDHMSGLIQRFQGVETTEEETRKEIYKNHLYYSAGPWLILDLLKSERGAWYDELIDTCMDHLSRKEALPVDKIHEVIKGGLMIDSQSFLDYFRTSVMEGR